MAKKWFLSTPKLPANPPANILSERPPMIQGRVGVGSLDRYKAGLLAGDKAAFAVESMLKSTGHRAGDKAPPRTKPNDILMATNYAYMLAKILLAEPMFADRMKLRLENTLRSNMA